MFLVLLFVLSIYCKVGLEFGWLEIRVNSCIGPMTFQKCVDVVGEFVEKPEGIIKNYTKGSWKVRPESGFTKPTLGNCTFTYENSGGTHVAFFDWDWAVLGDQTVAGGTSDVKDHELTTMSSKGTVHSYACFWLYYEGNWLDCYVKTGEKMCPQPTSGGSSKNVRMKLKR